MSWGIIGTAAVTFVGGVISNQSKNKQIGAQNANSMRQEALQWENNVSDNKAIQEANLQNMIRTGYKAGILNMQRGAAKREAAELGLGLGKNRLALAGANDANSFAAGQIGASVDAVAMDIQQRADEAQVSVDDAYLTQELNFDMQMHDLLTAGMDAQRSSRKATVQQAQTIDKAGMAEVALNTAISVGGNYLGQYMSLGMGKQTNPVMPASTGIGKPLII